MRLRERGRRAGGRRPPVKTNDAPTVTASETNAIRRAITAGLGLVHRYSAWVSDVSAELEPDPEPLGPPDPPMPGQSPERGAGVVGLGAVWLGVVD
ncbi:MAG: hypothetical protein QOD86_2771 [Miltoncostaeaceae bacterium]|jgi:DNA-binding transcriptional LysR family regulator|nr:hypothetical protein [Miltoncostaeaceae bacterium]